MCLIVFAYRAHPDFPLIVLANRDEFYDRPTQALAPWSDYPGLYAGRDLLAGGTWLGIHQQGRFAAITNYREGKTASVEGYSRGTLTHAFLTGTADARTYLTELNRTAALYPGFNLILGDASGLFYYSNRTPGIRKLTPSIYGLSNALLDTPWPKLTRARQALTAQLEQAVSIEALRRPMLDTTQPPPEALPDTGVGEALEQLLSSAFIASETYGTRATSVLLQAKTGETSLYEFSYPEKDGDQPVQVSMVLPVFGTEEQSDQPGIKGR